jgi:hypothetical protein
MTPPRKDSAPPLCISEWGWQYHHIGLPEITPIPGEKYIPHLKIFVEGFESSPFGIERMRFEEGCGINKLIREVPHIAFQVQNIEEALTHQDFNILTPPNSPGSGIRVAMIEHNGIPVELIEFSESKIASDHNQ